MSGLFVLLAACGPDEKEGSQKGDKAFRPQRPVYQELKVEVRDDGLAYLQGAQEPFTGDAIELHHDRTPPSLARRTPYVKGRKHGTVTTFTSGGKLREERSYEHGRPVHCLSYWGNGQKKIDVALNQHDRGEGLCLRWHDNGVLEAETHFDEQERFHGEEKVYDREGKLVGHYRNEHGRLTEIYFETPEKKERRLKHWADLEAQLKARQSQEAGLAPADPPPAVPGR